MERSTGPSGTLCQCWEVVTWVMVGMDEAIILMAPTIYKLSPRIQINDMKKKRRKKDEIRCRIRQTGQNKGPNPTQNGSHTS